MKTHHSLSHTKWGCKYHIVWVPKYRKKRLFGNCDNNSGQYWHKESEILEERLRPDHGHILIPIPPKFAVSQVTDCIEGKNAIYIAQNYVGWRRNFTG